MYCVPYRASIPPKGVHFFHCPVYRSKEEEKRGWMEKIIKDFWGNFMKGITTREGKAGGQWPPDTSQSRCACQLPSRGASLPQSPAATAPSSEGAKDSPQLPKQRPGGAVLEGSTPQGTNDRSKDQSLICGTAAESILFRNPPERGGTKSAFSFDRARPFSFCHHEKKMGVQFKRTAQKGGPCVFTP